MKLPTCVVDRIKLWVWQLGSSTLRPKSLLSPGQDNLVNKNAISFVAITLLQSERREVWFYTFAFTEVGSASHNSCAASACATIMKFLRQKLFAKSPKNNCAASARASVAF